MYYEMLYESVPKYSLNGMNRLQREEDKVGKLIALRKFKCRCTRDFGTIEAKMCLHKNEGIQRLEFKITEQTGPRGERRGQKRKLRWREDKLRLVHIGMRARELAIVISTSPGNRDRNSSQPSPRYNNARELAQVILVKIAEYHHWVVRVIPNKKPPCHPRRVRQFSSVQLQLQAKIVPCRVQVFTRWSVGRKRSRISSSTLASCKYDSHNNISTQSSQLYCTKAACQHTILHGE